MAHLVLIGAGPHGLAVLTALAARASWPERVTVVDPHGDWCSAWDQKLARLNLDRLRSPQVHHAGISPMQFRDLVEAQPEAEQLALRRPEAERAPTPLGMHRFHTLLAGELGPLEWLHGTATRLELAAPRPAAGADSGSRVLVDVDVTSAPAGTTAATDASALRLIADAVVLAHNPSRPRIPAWAEGLVASGAATHASTIDIRSTAVAGRHIVIIGGGLTAACLALEAVERGATVTLLARRPLRARPYDVDASWIGPRRLAPYLAAPVAERRGLIDLARDGGTIPPRTLDELREAAAAPGSLLTILEDVDTEAEALTRLEHHDSKEPPPLLWLATGFEQDIREDALLAPLVAELGIELFGGLPAVDEHLRLGAAPIYVAGPYAALGVGPACRNLAGARPAAQRIVGGLAR